MSKFKVGDRVKYDYGIVGVIGCIEGGIAFIREATSNDGKTIWSFNGISGSVCGKHKTFAGYSLDSMELADKCADGMCLQDELKINEAPTTSEKKGGIMMNIINFVKESLLSADEKALRATGLKDSCGDYTETANELVIAKLVKENEAYLIEVANKKIEADKENK